MNTSGNEWEKNMQLLWHGMVNASFGYLTLIAVVRIIQEVKDCVFSLARR